MDIYLRKAKYILLCGMFGWKRTQESCRRMMKKVFGRTEQPSPQTKMEMFTDGNDDYTYVLPEYCADASTRLWAACKDQGERASRP